MLIKSRWDLHFTGAKSGKLISLQQNVVTEIEEREIFHLDPKDYKVLQSGTLGQLLLGPEDIPHWLTNKMGKGWTVVPSQYSIRSKVPTSIKG